MARIGLFGGSFDPVHLGHMLVAQAACEELFLVRLYFIPAAQSPFKPAQLPAPAAERLRLLRLALAGHSNYEVDTQELTRAGLSFTIDTVRDYAERFPGAELYYLVGADHVPFLPQWREANELAKMVRFVVIPRPVSSIFGNPTMGTGTVTGTATSKVSGSVLGGGFGIQTLQGFPLAVSSSQIRQRVRDGLSIEALVPPEVAEAIRNNRLYLSAQTEQR
jgi:nicotinate-nucleotide adenylyltransferase